MIDAGAEVLYGHPRHKAVEFAKEDKFDSACDQAREVFEAMLAAAPEGRIMPTRTALVCAALSGLLARGGSSPPYAFARGGEDRSGAAPYGRMAVAYADAALAAMNGEGA